LHIDVENTRGRDGTPEEAFVGSNVCESMNVRVWELEGFWISAWKVCDGKEMRPIGDDTGMNSKEILRIRIELGLGDLPLGGWRNM
jgi:hypothetical protein